MTRPQLSLRLVLNKDYELSLHMARGRPYVNVSYWCYHPGINRQANTSYYYLPATDIWVSAAQVVILLPQILTSHWE